MPFCPQCGASVDDVARVCPSCGVPIQASTGQPAAPMASPPPVATTRKRPTGVTILAVLAILGALGAFIAGAALLAVSSMSIALPSGVIPPELFV